MPKAQTRTLLREGDGGLVRRTTLPGGLRVITEQVPGVRSVYRFEGAIHDDAEVLLIAKTRADRCEALAARITALHPYALPEVLALEAPGGSLAYRAWVATEAAG